MASKICRRVGHGETSRDSRMKLLCGFDASHLLAMLEKALAREKELWSPKIYEEQV